MCCKITLSVTRAVSQPFTALVHEIWGEAHDGTPGAEGWLEPTRRLLHDTFVAIDMDGSGHEVDPRSWLRAVKYAAGLYEEAVRRGLSPRLTQCGTPCLQHLIAEDGESPVNVAHFCRAGLGEIDG